MHLRAPVFLQEARVIVDARREQARSCRDLYLIRIILCFLHL